MRLAAVFAFLALAACGADGEPERPEPRETGPGVRFDVSGSAGIGVASR
ncbi:argininosuccinate lyase [Roseivivax sediminis]|uniref:Uncharacterized protein n=1 Tax=Roseivivax sediminis TaxID=936889 RepID=A0A1I1U199_9RHOB|nr:argininosuccinate lyase [Roseivivax sediminis]SFD64651.1 hypothetical protein SAMN04515678_10298 [Roseivivax sediminis]